MRSRAIRKTTFRGSAARKRGGYGGCGHRRRSITSIETFFAVAPLPPLPARALIYLYTRCFSYLYVDIFRPDETLPRIIKLAKYFRGHDRHNSQAPLARFALLLTPSLRTAEPRRRSRRWTDAGRRGRRTEGAHSRNTSTYLSRGRERGC